jgi:hypothetical protein
MRWWPCIVAAAACTACSPALDWREVRVADASAVAMLPCRPKVSTRTVSLAGRAVQLSMWACRADGLTWALAAGDVGDAAQVEPALRALLAGMRANLQGEVERAAPAGVRGALPHSAHERWRLRGRKPDGEGVLCESAVFASGSRVYQATVLGERLPPAAVDTFFEALRVRPGVS